MSEKPPKREAKPSPEKLAEYVFTEEQLEQAREYEESHSSSETAQLSPERCAEMVAELEGLYIAFEQKHDIEALYAITELDSEVAKDHPIREPARQDLPPIIAILKILEKQDAVSDEVFFQILDGQLRADRAVGTINNGRVDHWRPGVKSRRR